MRATFSISCVFLLSLGCGEDNSSGTASALGDSPTNGGSGAVSTGSQPATGSTTSTGGAANSAVGGLKATGGAVSGGTSSGATTSASGAPTSAGRPMVDDPDPPAPQVSDCNGLGARGVFEEITPPAVKAGIGQSAPSGKKGGTFAMAVDPVNQGTVYAGTLFQGVWKTTDCGSSWKLIASGTDGKEVNSGMNWTFAIDPQDPNVVYTNSGYGTNGLFKSTDGGVNWTDVWSKTSQPELGKSFEYNFANVVAIDPHDHEHLLLTFHEPCKAPHTPTCIAESKDAGASWTLFDGEPSWNGAEGQVIWFLDDSSTWLWGSQTNGFWRSGDAGKSWKRIAGMETSHKQGSQILRAKDGTFYAAASDAIWSSPDGQAETWKAIPNTGPIVGGLVSDGTRMYGSTAYFEGFGPTKYLTSPESDGKTWEVIPSPTIEHGGNLGYDAGHKLLYSSNLDSGMWRVVVE